MVQIKEETSRQKISAFIICKNEEEHIERALNSVEWCDEIILIDSGSTDRTLDIAVRYKNLKILSRDWPGHREQKSFGLKQCSNPWVLNLDADEELSPELQSEIKKVLENDLLAKIPYNGFYLSRIVYFLGRYWDKGGWYPEYRLRLLRRESTTWGGGYTHEKAIVDGATDKLKSPLYHYTYKDLKGMVDQLNSFSSLTAVEMAEQGRRFKLSDLVFRPVIRAIKFFILKRGYKEGLDGFIVALLEGYYDFLKYAKLREIKK